MFHCRDENVLLTLFKSLVLSILEYSSPLWSPHRVQDIAKLESVQRRYTSKMTAIQHLNYGDRLKHLKLMSLQRRRERYQIIYVWKILNGKVPNDIGFSWRESARKGTVAVIPRMPSSVLKINSSYDNFFKVRGAKLWNCVPKHVKINTSLTSFKETLDSFLLGVPDYPPGCGSSTANNNSLLDWLAYNSAF